MPPDVHGENVLPRYVDISQNTSDENVTYSNDTNMKIDEHMITQATNDIRDNILLDKKEILKEKKRIQTNRKQMEKLAKKQKNRVKWKEQKRRQCEKKMNAKCSSDTLITPKKNNTHVQLNDIVHLSQKEKWKNQKQKDRQRIKESPLLRADVQSKRQQQYKMHAKRKLTFDEDVNIEKQKAQDTYYAEIQEMPIFVCTCDHRMLYRRAVLVFEESNYNWSNSIIQTALSKKIRKKSSNGIEYICQSCHKKLSCRKRKRSQSEDHSTNIKLPSIAVANGLFLDDIPKALHDLSSLDRSFISLRILFMKILALPKGGQYGINGSCVNVPAKLDAICNLLPRLPEDVQFIPFKLKRKLQFKGHHMMNYINPTKVMNALIWLKQHNHLYQQIDINMNWELDIQQNNLWECVLNTVKKNNNNSKIHDTDNCKINDKLDESECSQNNINIQNEKHIYSTNDKIIDKLDEPEYSQNNIKSNNDEKHKNQNEDDLENQFQEDQEYIDKRASVVTQPYESCLQITNFENHTFCVAPGEGNKPVYILEEDGYEVLAFPDLFPNATCSYVTNEVRQTKLDMRRYFQQRILNVDGRFTSNIEYLLAAQYATELKQIKGSIFHHLRLKQGKTLHGTKVTAGLLRSIADMETLRFTDQAYKVLQQVRGSPPFWKAKLGECLAMLRTHGPPTFFVTFSAADYYWPEIIQTIGHQYGTSFSPEDIENMSWDRKSFWLRRNPVTAVRAFEHRFKAMHKYIMSKAQPLGEVTEFIEKVEFQARGSPHIHAIYWVKNAPVLGENSDEDVCSFHDKYIQGKLPSKNDPLYQLVKTRQIHSCSSNCKKKSGTCRYNFPKIPTNQTIVARDEKVNSEKKDNIKDNIVKVKEYMKTIYSNKTECIEDTNITLDDMLNQLQLSEDDYSDLIHSTNGNIIICMDRNICDVRVNNYNHEILQMWKANMDIQFVQNAISAVMYVCSYMMKSEKEMGELLRQICREAKSKDIKEQLKIVGSTFLGKREVSAQEAAMRLLSMHLIEKSRRIIFVHNSTKDTRVYFPKRNLTDLDDDDDDVFMKKIHDRYAARPKECEHMSLADFATIYITDYNASTLDTSDESCEIAEHLCHDTEAYTSLPKKIKLDNNLGFMTKCSRQAVLRTHTYKKEKSPNEYFYSKCLLFLPWRSEDVLATNPKELYEANIEAIEKNAKQYNQHSDEIDKGFETVQNGTMIDHMWDDIDESNENSQILTGMYMQDEGKEENAVFDVNEKTSSQLSKKYIMEAQKELLTTKEYCASFRMLNMKQKQLMLYIRQWCKNSLKCLKAGKNVDPFRIFLSGPGGTGKSHVIKMIHRDINYFFRLYVNMFRNEYAAIENPLVLLTAYTGTAAYNINGSTLHSTLALPVGGNKNISYEKRNTLENRLCDLKLFIIDEISLISQQILKLCHERLCLAKKIPLADNIYFGNTSILAVGDFYQLRPVGGSAIFQNAQAYHLDDLSPSLWDEFQVVEFTEIMRQKGDCQFANMLNDIRMLQPKKNSQTDNMLQKRNILIDDNHIDYPNHIMHAYANNKPARERNLKMLSSLPGGDIVSKAEDSIKTKLPVMPTFPSDPNQTGRLLDELRIKINARVTLTQNVNVEDGLTNGSMGTIKYVHFKAQKPEVILVEFDGKNVGAEAKKNSIFRNQYPNCVPITKHCQQFFLNKYKSVEACRIQFPLFLAWAVTIHKLQGLTLNAIVVEMSPTKGKFQPGHAYVAFSRVKNLEGLYLLNYTREQIIVNPQVEPFMENMKNVQLSPWNKINFSNDKFTICHLNVENLLTHKEDVDVNTFILSADIICFTETHLTAMSIWPLTNISHKTHRIFRQERTNCKGGGVAICVRKNVCSINVRHVNNIECIHLSIGTLNATFDIACIYRRPGSQMSFFVSQMSNLCENMADNSVIVGDFNEDILSKQTTIVSAANNYQYTQMIKDPTTDYSSLLDHVYVRGLHIEQLNVIDCYFSYHDLIVFQVNVLKS
jgi:hypothetical protein